jgi:hypothetical protein
MDDSRTLIEESKQLIVTARNVVSRSRTARANAQSSAHRAERILASARAAASARAVAKLSKESPHS